MPGPSILEFDRDRLQLAAARVEDHAVLIEWLKKEGHDTSDAEELFATFLALMDVLAKTCEELEQRVDALSALSSSSHA